MADLFRRVRHSSTDDHHLLPAADSHRTAIASFMSISTLFAWTFGSGAVFWRIWPAVLMHTLFATVITVVSLRTNLVLAIPNVMLTVLGVVIGFVISYRVICAYDQYLMGRTAWSNVAKNTTTLSRLIWFHVPLRLSPKTQQELAKPVAPLRGKEEVETVMGEKWIALEMLEGFAVSLKHYLRGELGIRYEDLYHLVKPLHEHHAHGIASQSPTAVGEPWHHRGKSAHSPLIPTMTPYSPMSIAHSVSASSSHSVPPPLLPASSHHSSSLLDRVSGDLIPFAAYLRGIFKFYRPSGKSDRQPEIGIDSHGGVQRRWVTGIPVVGRKTRRRIVRGDENLPVQILRLLSDWFAMLEERMTVPGTSLGAMIEAISALEDAVFVAERTLTTPLPFVYAVHIRQTVWIYLFFLPFQLIEQFSWYTIPGVALASFIYLGFLSAGDEIGQPFGYDENDLDLDLICREMIHADLARLKKTPGVNVLLGPHEATPHDAPAQADADLLGM